MSIFNERMREIKRISGLNKVEIANKLEISPSTLFNYFKDREPSYDVLMKIAREFNVSVNWLIGFDDVYKNELIRENLMLKEKLREIIKSAECALKGE